MENIIIILSGGLLSYFNRFLTLKMIEKRNDKPTIYRFTNTKIASILWVLFGFAGASLICVFGNSLMFKIELLIIFLICEALTAVDFAIRKIPNELLIALIAVRIVFLAINADMDMTITSVAGLIIGLGVFALPSFLRIRIGVGDIKFAAVAGFYLGTKLFFQAILVMGVVMGLYYIYLIITKRGNLRSMASIGPFISLGIFVSLLVPIVNLI